VAEYRTGDLIDEKYRVIGSLGAGAFGMVLRVEWLMDGHHYAMKLFHATAARELVQRELQAMLAVDHPNINRVRWADRLDDGQWFLLTELVDGGRPLVEIIDADEPMAMNEALHLVRQLVDALVALHPDSAHIDALRSRDELNPDEFRQLQELQNQGWVHRDISPKNLLVRPSGELVLIDFGIASRVGARVSTQSHTPGYTPPDADLTLWSPDIDLFAAGAVLFELLTGQLPYDPATGDRNDCRELRAEIPDEIAQYLSVACSARRSGRFQSAREMLRNLDDVIEHTRPHTETSIRGTPVQPRMDSFTYHAWIPRPLVSAATGTEEQVIEGLIEIVSIEGPIKCERLYQLYVEASGDPGVSSVKRHLTNATTAGVRQRRLAQIRETGGKQADKTVLVPGTPPVVIRYRGPRHVHHIPPSEIRAVAQWILEEGPLESFSDVEVELDYLDHVAAFYDALDDPWALHYLRECSEFDADRGTSVDHFFRRREGTPTTMAGIERVWQRIVDCQGQTFRQVRGREFTYEVSGRVLRLHTTNQNLSMATFEEALARVPLAGPGDINDLRGPSYVFAILYDDRIRQGEW
jgi:serine/threonine protein kinase